MSHNTTITELRQKPILTVEDLQIILRIGRTNAYSLVKNNPPFRVLRVNKSIRIPSKSFFDWIEGTKNNTDDSIPDTNL